MAFLLIITFLFQVFLILSQKSNWQNLRDSFSRALILLAAFIWVFTETLSFFSALDSKTVLALWTSANLLTALYLAYSSKNQAADFQLIFQKAKELQKDWFSKPILVVLWTLISGIAGVVLITALVFPPNTVDVITYHLARVAHWIQAGNIEFFPTNIERQLYNAPFAEFSLLHLQLLSGNDHFANLVQFFSYISIAVIASLIAKRFNLNFQGQLLSAFVVIAIPIAILQASSAKNDLVVTMFVCAFFYFYSLASESGAKSDYIFAGLSLGLAILTKGNAYFYCLPIGLFIFCSNIIETKTNKQRLSFIFKTSTILFLALIINFNHYYRNWQVFGSPLQAETRLKNDEITLPIVYANAVRNYAIHLGNYYEAVYPIVEPAVNYLLGSEATNPASTLASQKFSAVQSFDEEAAGNFLHLILLSIGVFYLLLFSQKGERKWLLVTILSIIGGFILVCIFLKWNLWVSRIHLPIFCLGSPLIALLLSRMGERKIYLILVGFMIGAVTTILFASPRNFFETPKNKVFADSRTDYYFVRDQNLPAAYLEATNFLKSENPDEIGLYMSLDYNGFTANDWEYTLWILLKEDFTHKPKLRHFGVSTPSGKLNSNNSPPEWIISTNKGTVIDNVAYEVVWEKNAVKILRRQNR